MRLRSAALLSTVAVAALVLAGCSADDDVEPTGEDGLCGAAAASGDAVDSLEVSGTAADGVPDELQVDDNVSIDEFQRALVTEGAGEPLQEGDWVSYAIAAYDATTGEQLGTNGYTAGDSLPVQMSLSSPLAGIMGCAPVGSRVVTAYPSGTDQTGAEYAAQIQIVDVLGTVPTAAWGSEQEPVEGMPAVTLAEDGEPTLEIPDGFATGEATEVVPTKIGDGIEVREGDTVLLQYKGYSVSDGESFDQSWPTPFGDLPTTNYVEGFGNALVGQTVGSQIIAMIPREEGYGMPGYEDHDLYEEDLVFVVDILGTRHDGAAAE